MRRLASRTSVRCDQKTSWRELFLMADNTEISKQLNELRDELLTRLDGLDRRLEAIERGAAAQPVELAPSNGNGHSEVDTSAPLRTVSVTIAPLHDVSRVRVVEDAFGEIDGVESTSLHTLRGDEAHLEVKAHEGVPLIAGLRRTLGVAFDISESDDSSFTIALAQPRAEREGGVAAHDA
jgi:hypothetical protein